MPLLAAAAEVTDQGLEPALTKLEQLYNGFVARLPLIAFALLLGAIGIWLALKVAQAVQKTLVRRAADVAAAGMLARVVRVVIILAVLLLVLGIAGVQVGPALAGLGIAGLALALALQGILENFIAGVILLVRKPFRAGDQIRSNDLEGTVADIDLRVTKLIDYSGELILIPNVLVYNAPLVNLTRRGKRRTELQISVDYRDDHDAARDIIRAAVARVEGVMDDPPPEVLLTELGDSGVEFDIRYWTLPDIMTVRRVQDRVLSAAKTAVEAAGMTIPWPIRTLVVDNPVRVEQP